MGYYPCFASLGDLQAQQLPQFAVYVQYYSINPAYAGVEGVECNRTPQKTVGRYYW